MEQPSRWWMAGAVSAALAVGLGAFGAHGLKGQVEPALLETWRTAAHYHLLHSVALLAVAVHPRKPVWAPRLLALGLTLFSGSLYVLVLSGVRALGAITPLGGLCLMGGWLLLAWTSRPRAPYLDAPLNLD